MSDQINNKNDNGEGAYNPDHAINKKLDELLGLLSNSQIDSEKAKDIQQRINTAIDEASGNREDEAVGVFKNLDTDNLSRADLLDEFSILLNTHQIDSKVSKKYLRAQRGANVVLMAIGLLMITLGLAMIVMPAPPDFEIYTIYYFNINDGVTVMDLISLLVVLCGVYLFIKSLYSLPVNQQK